MNLPPKIRVGPWYYQCSVEPLEDEQGKSSFDSGYLKINSNQNEEKQAGALFHELGHQWLDIAGIKLTTKIEEAVVVAMEHGVAAFAKDHCSLFVDMIRKMSGGEFPSGNNSAEITENLNNITEREHGG